MIKMQEDNEQVNESPQLKDNNESSRLDSDEEASSSGQPVEDAPNDRLAQLRREKRLAMNRESARIRRKNKKERLQTLEKKVDALSQENESYRVAYELLNKRAQALERELATAKATIASLMSQASSLGATNPHHLSPQAALLTDNLRSRVDAATSDANMRRLLEAQHALSRPAAARIAAASMPSVADGRASLGLGSESSLGRGIVPRLPQQGDNFAALGPQVPAGLHAPSFQNTLPGRRELGLGDSRIGGDLPAALLRDAISSQTQRAGQAPPRDPAALQVLEELLKQQQQNRSGGKHF